MTTIALDAMGGDFGPAVVVPAALLALKQFPALKLTLVGQETVLRKLLSENKATESERLQIFHAEEVVAMDEKPAHALRSKRQSSMRLAINEVKEGHADACVSAGNTGALMAIGKTVLKTLPGIDRPAIITQLPAKNGRTHVLDLGANVYCNEEHLMQFAIMGSVLAEALTGNTNPTVGLLNIGEEDIKGNEQVKEAAKRLSETTQLNYVGFVEGDDIYEGKTDVVVCDGFVGNIALKTSEGLARLIFHTITQGFKESLWGKSVGLLVRPIMKKVKAKLDPRVYNGASFIGLRRPLIKSHGSADVTAYVHAIRNALYQVENNVPERVSEKITLMMQELEQ